MGTRDAVEHLLDLQRQIDAIERFADRAGAPVSERSARLAELYRELDAARRRAAPALKRSREFSALGGSGGLRGGTGGLPGLKQASADVEVLVDLRMPSVPTSLARLFAVDGVPLVSVRVRNGSARPRRLCVSTSVEGFSAHALTTITCPPGEQQLVEQFPTFFPDAIAKLDEFCVGSLLLEVHDLEQGVALLRKTLPVRLLARQTAVLYQLDPQSGEYRDYRHTLGAWITPNARPVLELLRTAADFSSLRAMSGYQVDEAGVLEHVRAVFEALKAATIVYVNSVDAFGGVDGQFLQRVRTPSESLACKSANCVDGTVLMASLLEATGIEAAIVLVPGHAYLGFLKRQPDEVASGALAPELERPEQHLSCWDCLETTLIGSGSFEDARKHALAATANFHSSDLLTILPVTWLRRRNITPLE